MALLFRYAAAISFPNSSDSKFARWLRSDLFILFSSYRLIVYFLVLITDFIFSISRLISSVVRSNRSIASFSVSLFWFMVSSVIG